MKPNAFIMKTIIKTTLSSVLAVTLLIGFASAAETPSESPKTKIQKTRAHFLDGDEALYSYIQKNVVYPDDLREEGYEATVYVDFVVNHRGEISDVMVHQQECTLPGSKHDDKTLCKNPACEQSCEQFQASAMDVIKGMEGWTPATVNGKTVNQKFRIPIRFEIK